MTKYARIRSSRSRSHATLQSKPSTRLLRECTPTLVRRTFVNSKLIVKHIWTAAHKLRRTLVTNTSRWKKWFVASMSFSAINLTSSLLQGSSGMWYRLTCRKRCSIINSIRCKPDLIICWAASLTALRSKKKFRPPSIIKSILSVARWSQCTCENMKRSRNRSESFSIVRI